MSIIIDNVKNELQKLFLKKKTIVLLIITAIISFLPGFFVSAIQKRVIFVALDSVSFPLMILSIICNILLPLFIFMSASELFSGEVADRTMKLVLTRPISRFKIYVSKNIAVGVYAIINLLIVFIVSTVSSLVLKLNTQNIAHILFSYFIDIIPAIVFSIFAAFLAQFFRSSSASIISSILIYAAIKVVSFLGASFNNIIFTSYLNWYSLWASGSSTILRNINILLMLIAYGIIFFTCGYYIFDKKEF